MKYVFVSILMMIAMVGVAAAGSVPDITVRNWSTTGTSAGVDLGSGKPCNHDITTDLVWPSTSRPSSIAYRVQFSPDGISWQPGVSRSWSTFLNATASAGAPEAEEAYRIINVCKRYMRAIVDNITGGSGAQVRIRTTSKDN
jgi:hypothetical protein